jgi:hypothetical protein
MEAGEESMYGTARASSKPRVGSLRYPLDNAGTGFSLICSPRVTTVFRIEAEWRGSVEVERLARALARVLPRFPAFRVQRCAGFAWYFWETNRSLPAVEAQRGCPNRYLSLGGEGRFPFRVLTRGNTIALELHHSLTDGFGGLQLLKSLLLEYARLEGGRLGETGGIRQRGEQPGEEELEDSYQRYYRRGLPRVPLLQRRAFLLPFRREPTGVYHVTTGELSVAQVRRRARELGCRLNVLFIALYLQVLQALQARLLAEGRIRRLKPVRLMIPVNLRTLYPSQSLRNFSLYVTPGLDPRPGEYSLEEAAAQVKGYLARNLCTEALDRQIGRNVGSQNNPLLSMVPLPLKRLSAGLFYYLLGSSLHSGMLTNLGRVELPPALERQVEGFRFIPAPLRTNRVGAAMVGFRDTLRICFGRISADPAVEREFFRRVQELGLTVRVWSDAESQPP